MKLGVTAIVIPLCLATILGGCTPTALHSGMPTLSRSTEGTSVLVMPLDIELAEVTTGGVREPKGDWTDAARTHILGSLKDKMRELSVATVEYVQAADDMREHQNNQLRKLHEAIAGLIMLYSVAPTAEFIPPTRRTNAGWSLGPSVARLRDEFGADYALFTYIRDSYATAGRIAVQVFTALLSRGAYIAPGGAQVGYASLVDLRTGEIVWFNRLARAVGDLRSPEPARETMQVLLLDFPK